MRKILLLGVVVALFISCKNTGKQAGAEESANPKLAEFYETSKGVLERPAKPSQISALLTLSGAPLMTEKMNSPSNWESYKDHEIAAAANMGVYLADAIIQYAYDEKKLAYNSAIAAKSLAEEIGINNEIFMGYLIGDRYREEGGQSDSLFFVLDSALARADQSLNANDRFKILSAMYIGNYIEKQFVLSNIVFEYPVELPEESKLLILRDMIYLLDQSLERLDYIIMLVEKAYSKNEVKHFYKELKELREINARHRFTREQLEKLQAKDIFENQNLKDLHNKIVSIREMIVASE